jgi:hypothetical protein
LASSPTLPTANRRSNSRWGRETRRGPAFGYDTECAKGGL